jgi:hypothetical protein
MAFRSPTKPSSQTDMMASCVSALPADAPVACAGAAVKMIILLLNRLHQVKCTTTKRVPDFIGGSGRATNILIVEAKTKTGCTPR